MKKVFSTLLCVATIFAMSSCSDKEGDVNGGQVDSSGSLVYVLNSGSVDKNNATLSSYDLVTKESVDCVFSAQNIGGLGDTAQDMVLVDGKIFISVYGSNVIFVTDLEGKQIAKIEPVNEHITRSFATDGDDLYVSFYDGAVAKIDTDSYELTISEVAASGNPDQLAVANGKVYVTVSDWGYGNEKSVVSVFDAETMEFVENIEVVYNPTQITAASNGDLYVLSMGDYGKTVSQAVQKIDAGTTEAKTITTSGVEGSVPSYIRIGKDDVLYVIEGVSNEENGYKMDGSVYALNPTTGKAVDFITDGTKIDNLFSLTTDLVSGEIYIGTSDYNNTGDVYVLNADGTLKTKFGVGLNPMRTIVVDLDEK